MSVEKCDCVEFFLGDDGTSRWEGGGSVNEPLRGRGDALLIDELFLGDGEPAFGKDSKDDGDGLLLDECIFDDGEALLPDVLRPDVLFLGEGEEVLLDNPLSID